MAKGYRPVNRDQPFLLPPDMREWLPREHLVFLVIRAVEQMDTSAFHAARKTGGAGTAGYDPDMLVTVLVWAYAHGVTSSREMERAHGRYQRGDGVVIWTGLAAALQMAAASMPTT
jgi:transposase